MAAYTVDTLFDPPLVLCQPETGYRFSLDPVILAGHILPEPGQTVMDIGCGCGIISLILASRHPGIRVIGIDIQKPLAHLAEKNTTANRLDARVKIVHQDVRTLTRADIPLPIDRVVSNPPYGKTGAGRLSPDPGRALARHELTLDIPALAAAADAFLSPGGHLHLILPASRIQDLTPALKHTGFGVKWLRRIHFHPRGRADRVILCAVKAVKATACVCPPLYLYHADGSPTQEHQALLQW
ncbi:MAG: tRNA1(Val) (adenine(37)-N6)-methyltransferase [Thermodesulfobacteriota bacterium]